MDGNFLHAVAEMKLGNAKDVVVKFLGSPAKLFTTRCVKEELRGMGHDFKQASLAARHLEEVKGGPEPPRPPSTLSSPPSRVTTRNVSSSARRTRNCARS